MINNGLFILLLFAFLMTTGYWFTRGLIGYAYRKQMLDRPNERSSHTQATPRIGGLSFVVLISLLMLWAILTGQLTITSKSIALVLLILPAFIVAATGLIDDIKGLSQKSRFGLYLFSSFLVAANIYLPISQINILLAAQWVLVALVVAWWINLFNFMDGIDGIAGTQGIFILTALAWTFFTQGEPSLSGLSLLACAPIVGFLVLNWQPAKIFMGDIGSTFLGCFIASLACYAMARGLISVYSLLILGGCFWVDASWTLAYRIISKQKWHQAHRSHSYQILSRHFGSHQKVTLGYLVIGTLWLFPLSRLTEQLPMYGLLITVISWLPLIAACFIIGAGKSTSN